MKQLYNYFFLSVLALNMVSCTEEVQTPPYMGYEYFPDSVGHYITYRVDSIWTDDAFNRKDTYEFGLKEWVESKFLDNEDRPSQRIERYKDFNPEPYDFNVISDVWFATRTAARAEKIEENTRYVKLIFPLAENEQWNGNAFNTIEDFDIDYKMYNVHQPFTDTLTGITFDSTVTVLQIDRQPIFDYRTNVVEVYAKHIGLVYKYYYNVNWQKEGNPPVDVLYGAQYKYHYLEHGYE
jgi:hypothetical protein